VDSLSNGGYQVDLAVDGDDGLRRSRPNGYAVMTIDRMLPRLDGLIVLRRLREDGIVGPALTLSALGGTDDRVQGLRAGYDDYVIKPFLARVDALTRRSEAVVKETVLRVGDLVSCMASRSGREIELLPRRFYLLEYPVRNDSGAFFIQPAAARHR
jgi:two-component system, OmpR family, response regulator